MILRVEDIDSPRIKPWAAAQAIDDLRWLGLDWDEGPDVGGPNAPYVQTHRMDHYQRAIEQLVAADRVYPCTCTRADIAAAASAPHVGQEGPRYPGTCSNRSASHSAQLGDQPFAWRFRTSSEPFVLHDLMVGSWQCHVSAELGDFVVGKSDGTPAYQLAVVVDDHAMGVTEVLRGDDLLPSACRQWELYNFFGWAAPQFAHVPLIVGPDGRRLAKRHGDTRLSEIRKSGFGSEKLIGLLAWSCGLRPTPEPTTARHLLADFDLAMVSRTPFVFTDEMWQQVSISGWG